MRVLISLLAVCIMFAASCSGQSTELPAKSVAAYLDITADWNDLASAYNFTPGPWSPNQTFVQTYSGSDFDSDLYKIWQQIRARNWTELQGITLPPMDDDDIISYDLEHVEY